MASYGIYRIRPRRNPFIGHLTMKKLINPLDDETGISLAELATYESNEIAASVVAELPKLAYVRTLGNRLIPVNVFYSSKTVIPCEK